MKESTSLVLSAVKFIDTPLKDVKLIQPKVFGDVRGFFLETWQIEKFAAAGIDATFVQDNHSRSSQWTLRGLHFQVQQIEPLASLVHTLSPERRSTAIMVWPRLAA